MIVEMDWGKEEKEKGGRRSREICGKEGVGRRGIKRGSRSRVMGGVDERGMGRRRREVWLLLDTAD